MKTKIEVIKFKPTTNGIRHRVKSTFSELTDKKNVPKKILLTKINRKFGIDNKGRRRFLKHSGKHKRKYRKVNFKRNIYDIFGIVERIEYDPNRSANLALIKYKINDKIYYEYILALVNLKKGDRIISYDKIKPQIVNGNAMRLSYIPVGTDICNVQIRPNSYNTIARSAGNYMTVLFKDENYVKVVMPSKEIRLLNINCYATIGRIGNASHNLEKKGKAGINFYKGRKPHVSGLAKNVCDHKHGGGKNSPSIGLKSPVSAIGLKTLGFKTRKNKRTSRFIIKRIN
jgi:large subunit ribosomal protein L2